VSALGTTRPWCCEVAIASRSGASNEQFRHINEIKSEFVVLLALVAKTVEVRLEREKRGDSLNFCKC